MFSGIVEGTGTVTALTIGQATCRLTIEAAGLFEGAQPGESVAINGACLTLAEKDTHGRATFDLMPETLRRTNLARLATGHHVNVEQSLRLGDRLGGHFVQGHIDGTAEVVTVESEGEARVVRFRLAEPRLGRYIVEKGFVAVDGVSLTVVEALPDGFTVSLVRTTLDRTILGHRVPGTLVNVEVDVFARYLVDRPERTPIFDHEGWSR